MDFGYEYIFKPTHIFYFIFVVGSNVSGFNEPINEIFNQENEHNTALNILPY